MKKLLILPMIVLITSCGIRQTSAPVATPVPTPDTELNQAVQDENSKKINTISSSQKSLKTDNLSKVRSCEYDFDSDGNADTVTLYSNAEITSSGTILWDDFHEWLLEVELSTGGFYPLFNNSISTGQIYFELFEMYNDEVTPAIAVFMTSGNGLDIHQFAFNGENFTEQTVYSTEEASTSGINKIYSSIPFYK